MWADPAVFRFSESRFSMPIASCWAARRVGSCSAIWFHGISTPVIVLSPENVSLWNLGCSCFWSDISLPIELRNTANCYSSWLSDSSSVKFFGSHLARILDSFFIRFVAPLLECTEGFFELRNVLQTKRNKGERHRWAPLIGPSLTHLRSLLPWLPLSYINL